jgi:hypothetical protein
MAEYDVVRHYCNYRFKIFYLGIVGKALEINRPLREENEKQLDDKQYRKKNEKQFSLRFSY